MTIYRYTVSLVGGSKLNLGLLDRIRRLRLKGRNKTIRKELAERHLIPPLRVFPKPRSLFDASRVAGLREVSSYRVGENVYPVDVWVRVFETGEGGFLYHVEEPRLNAAEVAMYEDIMNLLYFEPPEEESGRRFFKAVVDRMEELLYRYSAVYTSARVDFVRYYLMREALGYGYIEPLMRDPHIEDVSCNGYDAPVYVWHTGYEYVETTMRIPERELDRLVLKLAHISGKHLSIANPIVDAILPGGHRLAATYRKEVTTSGSTFTIRKFREKPISVVELLKLGTMDPYIAAYAWVMMEHKRNGLILGVTGAGKTTLLNAVATLIHPNYKVVTIEDTPELRLPLPNWVQLVSREFAVRSDIAASITLFDLVKLSLRYRPEIIMVGEVRGEEAYVLFQAMATGHGGVSTLHAESIEGAIERLTSPPMNIPRSYMPLIHFSMMIRRVDVRGHTARRVTNIWEVADVDKVVEVFRWRASTDSFERMLRNSVTLERIARDLLDVPVEELLYREIPVRALLFYSMQARNMTSFKHVAEMIARYYNDPSMRNRILSEAKSLAMEDNNPVVKELLDIIKK